MKILLFGIARDIVGSDSFQLADSAIARVSDIKDALERIYPKFRHLSSYMVAINNEYAQDDQPVQQQDEIAIIPPVSGG